MRIPTLVTLGICGLAGIAAATVHVVHPDGTGDFPTIQAALDAAVDGDVVELTDGTFVGTGNHNLRYHGKRITVRSRSGDPQSCTIDCQGFLGRRGFWFLSEGEEARLAGVTITGGMLSGSVEGAGVCCEGACPTIANCIFDGNDAGCGGGLHCGSGAAPQLSGCRFIGNIGGDGGAVSCIESSPTFIDCAFHTNFATRYGGAVWCFGEASPGFIGCEFRGNTAGRDGGALHGDFGCDIRLRSCTFVDSYADRGGALYMWLYSDPAIENCTFYDNRAFGGGAVMYCFYGSDPLLESCILAFGTLGEAFVCDNSESPCWPLLRCCDIYGNAGGDWTGCIAEQHGIDGNISADPLFCDAAGGNFRLQPESPCAPFSPPNEECDLIGAWGVGCDPMVVTPVCEPTRARLAPPVPNPFGTWTRIEYRLLGRGTAGVRLDVLDAAGRSVRTLSAAPAAAGVHRLLWDGRDGQGRLLPSGVYLLRLASDGATDTRRLVLAR